MTDHERCPTSDDKFISLGYKERVSTAPHAHGHGIIELTCHIVMVSDIANHAPLSDVASWSDKGYGCTPLVVFVYCITLSVSNVKILSISLLSSNRPHDMSLTYHLWAGGTPILDLISLVGR